MKVVFQKEHIKIARAELGTLICVARRKLGASSKMDEEVTYSGVADLEADTIVDALLRWFIHPNDRTLQALKDVVNAL